MKRQTASRVFFPWERRRGVFGIIGRARGNIALGVIAFLIVIVWIRGREEKSAAVRATRASITTMYRAVASFRADHSGSCRRSCPSSSRAGIRATSRSTRGAARCGSHAQDGVILWDSRSRATAPDGIAGGLDRVE